MYVYLTTLASLALLAQASSEFEPILEARHGMSRHQSHHDVHKHRVIAEKAALLPAVASRKPLLPVHGKASPLLPTSSGLKLITSYTGAAFLDQSQWTYFTDPDPTHGIVDYVDQQTAVSSHLAYVNSAGNFVSAVDSTTQLAQGQGRKSVRITSTKTFNQGQVAIFDAAHMPVGCATWPAYWLVGPNWPNGGEVDIIEGVSNSRVNQVTLHTSQGCTLATPMKASGKVVGTNCFAYANSNEGCGVQVNSTLSWGAPFNANGGGVIATQFDEQGNWSVWFFPRNAIPADITAGRPVPSSWGLPSAFFASTTCPSRYFSSLDFVINTTLCGDWAGAVFGQGDGCPGTCASAVANPSNYKQAYWEIKSLKVYG